MQSYNNLCSKLCSYDKLLLAFKKVRKDKTKDLYTKDVYYNTLVYKMKLTLLIKKLALTKDKFILSGELKGYCKQLKIDYLPTIKYLLRNDYLVRILKGIFYIKSYEERKFKRLDINHFYALKKALEIKKVDNWYFGLETALKMNNLIHEYYSIDYLVTNSIFRPKPINVFGHKIRFIKINKNLLMFGIIKKNVNYSDTEKTILDIIYLSKYHGLNKEAIKNKIIDLLKYCSKNKIRNYLIYYPKTVANFIGELNDK